MLVEKATTWWAVRAWGPETGRGRSELQIRVRSSADVQCASSDASLCCLRRSNRIGTTRWLVSLSTRWPPRTRTGHTLYAWVARLPSRFRASTGTLAQLHESEDVTHA